MPTTLFRGGRIRADFGGVVHDSVLARDGRIVAVGSVADVRAASGPVDETVDLAGAWVVPGLIDAHPHLLHFGVAAAGLADLSGAADHGDIVAAITTVASGRAPGEWVMATPVGEPHYFFRRGQQDLREGALPDRVTLDEATVRHPVMIQAWSPTMPNVCALNSAGLVALGINAASPDRVADVWIEKDASGVPTGRLFGAVTTNYNTDPFFGEILLRLPAPPSHLVEHATLQAIAAHHRLGITAVYEPHAMEPRHIDVYRRMRDSGRLSMRVKAVPEYQRFTRPSDHQKSIAELAATLDDALIAVDVGDDWLRVEGITVSAGGTCASGNMPWPTTYLDAFGHETSGRWFISHEAIEQAVEFCARSGLRLNVCAMGPAEHDVLLELVERHGVRDGIVQHGALMPLVHARRWAACGFRQTICCGFTWGKGDVYRTAFGSESIADLNPLRRLLDEGTVLAASTDWGPKNPWEQMWLAHTHLLGHSGIRNDGPAQVVTRTEAIEMWTSGAASVLDWPELGRLRPGSYADFVVVDRDPLTCELDELPGVVVLSTVTAGRTVFASA
ncbi:MAG TPA: amidohydrolase family protein [Ilumatobacteraceae bacterium]|nr:amidohydrolase family protein [Ilumatobacteraceae bacterium]